MKAVNAKSRYRVHYRIQRTVDSEMVCDTLDIDAYTAQGARELGRDYVAVIGEGAYMVDLIEVLPL